MKTLILFQVLVLTIYCHQAKAQIRSGDKVIIDAVVEEDLYIVGGTVTVNAPVRGDLIVTGGTIILNDTVSQDLLIAGGNILLNGVISDDVRCAGGKIELNGSVQGDFVVVGGKINIGERAIVFGEMLASGGEVTLDGNVKGNIRNTSGAFVLNGVAEHELHVRGGKILIDGQVAGKTVMAANLIELGTNAKFDSDVNYWNEEGSLEFNNSIKGSKATYDPQLKIENGKWHYLGFASFIMVVGYLGAALVLMFVIQYLFSRTLKNAANTIRNASLKSLALGVLFLAGVPVAVVIFLITIIGIPIGLLMLISYVIIILLATIIVSLLISNWINNTYYQASWGYGRITMTAFCIFVFLKLASITPFIGPLVLLLLICMAFGGILLNVNWKSNKMAFT
jgi:hypothetical protein